MVLEVLGVVLGVVPGVIQGFLRKSPNASLEAFGDFLRNPYSTPEGGPSRYVGVVFRGLGPQNHP